MQKSNKKRSNVPEKERFGHTKVKNTISLAHMHAMIVRKLKKSKDKARTYKLNAADKKAVKQKSSVFFESESESE